ncbi:hypothetical protein MT349_16770 [Rathayibacter caricis]|jgi:uncharacterized membrane protein|uniref:hypothetical protein n=1 Tax=Rathayibacter caricis TaxID=110936 RepID=UPI001FB2DCEB|nr:hypothetical protein [Rathayibacter caricis]MCJ1697437.1 hypothetical protein [Rathayibacter caricis]
MTTLPSTVFFSLYIVVVVVGAVLAVVLVVLLCRLAIAARETLQTTTRLRELQIVRLLEEEDDGVPPQNLS